MDIKLLLKNMLNYGINQNDPNYKKQHIVRLGKPFGVIGYCSRNSIQGFNYLR